MPDYAHHITTCPTGFTVLPTALHFTSVCYNLLLKEGTENVIVELPILCKATISHQTYLGYWATLSTIAELLNVCYLLHKYLRDLDLQRVILISTDVFISFEFLSENTFQYL